MDALAPDGVLTCRGVKIPKGRHLPPGRARRALREGRYESKEAEAALKLVRPGDRVLELGAGLGFMSTLLAMMRQGVRVDSFEANPTLIPVIRATHALNAVADRVTVHHALLAGRSGPPVSFYERQNFLASSLDPGVMAEGIIAEHAVPVRAINDELARLRPDVLVCDIEGAEADLLPQADLSGLRGAVVETHPQWIGQAGVRAVFDAFHRAGLAYWAKGSQGKVVAFSREW